MLVFCLHEHLLPSARRGGLQDLHRETRSSLAVTKQLPGLKEDTEAEESVPGKLVPCLLHNMMATCFELLGFPGPCFPHSTSAVLVSTTGTNRRVSKKP